MTLALPINIAAREDRTEILLALLRSLPTAYCHVWEGRLSGQPLAESEQAEIAQRISECSLIYLLEGMRGRVEPVVAFIANHSLGLGQLQYCIDAHPTTSTGNVPLTTASFIAGFARAMFAEHTWLNEVRVPGNMSSVDGFIGLKVAAGESSTITLANAAHRPWSARKLATQ